jgi:hypothetical protein
MLLLGMRLALLVVKLAGQEEEEETMMTQEGQAAAKILTIESSLLRV